MSSVLPVVSVANVLSVVTVVTVAQSVASASMVMAHAVPTAVLVLSSPLLSIRLLQKIRAIVAVPEVGEIYDGVVRSIMPYGCFVEIMPGKDGLLHISEIDWKRLETVEEAGIKEGDHIQVKLLEIDPKTGKYKLSHRVLIEKPEGYVERPARGERRERPERGERRPRPERGERRDRGDRGPRPERRPRPENGELAEKLAEKLGEEFRAPSEKHEPKDFSDALDHMDF